MSTTSYVSGTAVNASRERSSPFRFLWHRELDHFPPNRQRIMILGVVVLSTIVLYYQLYVAGAVAPSILQSFNMTFRYYVYISVVGNAVGAFSSILAGLADRWGRANLVTYGLLITALLVLFGIPNAPNKTVFALLVIAVGFVEGIILVATPALVRDFSPQLGRASAMGFWTLGPVMGSLFVSVVSSHTLDHLHAWQDQFVICGIFGLVVFALALFFLRELSPPLRDQLMVSAKDRALIEMRAKGLNVEDSIRHPWRQMLHLDVVSSAVAISVFLLVYYAAVGFFVIYFNSIFGFSEQRANAIGNWFWGFDALVLVIVGFASDRLRVRKPFMLVGAVGAIVMTIIFLTRTTHPHTTYYSFALIISLLAMFLAIAYAPWMASFTETVEKRNPALTATGLAVWGWTIRIIVALSALLLPVVVSSMTPLVDYGARVQAASVLYAPELATASVVSPAVLQVLAADPTNTAAATEAVGEIVAAFHVTPAVAEAQLGALATASQEPNFQFLQTHGPQVQAAAKQTPGQWEDWWWICVAGEVVFLLLVFTMWGRWSPRKAKADADAHARMVDDEMQKLEEGQLVTA
jgi:MFS family permease